MGDWCGPLRRRGWDVALRDRLVRGSFAGMVGILFVITTNLTSYHVLHFAKARWVDALSQVVYGHAITNGMELALGFFAFFVFAGIIGALFVYLALPVPGQGAYLLRGVGWGLTVWFGTYAVGTFFRIPGFWRVAWETAITQIIGVAGWGLIIGGLMRRWDRVFVVRKQ